MSLFFAFFIFFLGTSVGSFLNVLIDRLPRGEQVFSGRSYCESCGKKLAWCDLIPVFSWVFLRGRCRFCHSPIPVQYPLVELATGVLTVFLIFHLRGVPQAQPHLGGVLTLTYYLIIISALIVIFFTDLKYQIIPDKIIYSAIILTSVFQIINYKSAIINITNPLFSSFGAGLFFLSLVTLTRGRGMGLGDVKLVALMGLILGFPKIVVALYLAFLTGALVGVILVIIGKKRFGQHLPFGPFLAGATMISLFWGQELWEIYQKIAGLV